MSCRPIPLSTYPITTVLDFVSTRPKLTESCGGAPRAKSIDNTIRYSLVRDDGQWKIDDISGASDGEAWSIRQMLVSSLKN